VSTHEARDRPSSLGHLPDGEWTFDDEVTSVFDDMLERSIPQYDTMRGLVFELGRRFVADGSTVVDLGCSRGGALAPFVATFGDRASYVGVEVSPPMLHACRTRFASELDAGVVSVLDLDLRTDYPDVPASLTLAVLTLQFVPVDERSRIVRAAREHTVAGGAFVLTLVREFLLGDQPDVVGAPEQDETRAFLFRVPR
jgi:tRNA (cmo5U34)-methyltransferase